MRAHPIIASIAVALSCALCSASCVQGLEVASETEGTPDDDRAVITTSDEGDVEGDFEAAGNPQLLAVCLVLAPAPVSAKVAFCDSLPDTGMYARCMSHRSSRPEWIGWCYFEFSD